MYIPHFNAMWIKDIHEAKEKMVRSCPIHGIPMGFSSGAAPLEAGEDAAFSLAGWDTQLTQKWLVIYGVFSMIQLSLARNLSK